MKFTTWRKQIHGYERGLWKASLSHENGDIYRQKHESDSPKDSATLYLSDGNGKHMMVSISKEELAKAGLVWKEA